MEKMLTRCCSTCGVEKPLTAEFYNIRRDTKVESFRKQCMVCRKKKADENYRANRLEILERKYKKRKSDPEKRRENQRRYLTKKRKLNPLVRVRENVCRRINGMISNGKKTKTTEQILGCTFEQFKQHLENKFKPGMSWDNYGKFGWHIDHITPISLAKSQDEIYKLCHHSNLQPLWWDENIRKSNKLPEEIEI